MRSEDDRKRLRNEKDDAKLRSAKLYYNNPTMADLSDPYRPEKLAEQFMHLYDYTWSIAYVAFADLKFTEREIVENLLDLVMESNEFCVSKLNETWSFVQEWFLVKDSSSVETIKALIDGRKQKVVDKVQQIQEEFYVHVREIRKNDLRLTALMTSMGVKAYINECIRCCLMMNACDPPVIIEIPGWKPLKDRPVKFETKVHKQKLDIPEEDSMRLIEQTSPEQGQTTGNNLPSDDYQQSRTNQAGFNNRGQKQKPAHDTASVDDQNKMDETGAAKRNVMETSIEMVTFDQTKFREFTCRGKYVDFFVWPVVYLYRNGAMLSRGVAQGLKSLKKQILKT